MKKKHKRLSPEDFKKKFENKYKNCLFRYFSINKDHLLALQNGRLYFSIPITFNDPFDNLIYADLSRIWGHINNNLENGMDDYLGKCKSRDPMNTFIFASMWYGPEKDKMLQNHYDRICNIVDGIKKSIRINNKVICLSEIYNSMLMWSHYANNHTGFALIYDPAKIEVAKRYDINEKELSDNIILKKVKYVKKQVDLTQYIEDYIRYEKLETMGDVEVKDGSIPQSLLIESLAEKSEEWGYEKEWRIIPKIINLEFPSPLKYLECLPEGIIIAARCSDVDSKELIRIGKSLKIPIYRMFLDEFSPEFKLNINDGMNANVI